MFKKPMPFAVCVVCLAILSCNIQQGQELQNVVGATLTAIAAATNAAAGGGAAATPTTTLAPPPAVCSATVTANLNANVRAGPGTDFDTVGNLLTGQSAPVSGRNADGTWWYIEFGAGHAWIAASTVTPTCIPASVAIIAEPPTPTASVVLVTSVSVSVSPPKISVPGCFGPIMPSTASATIAVNGAIKLEWHFVSQQNGPLPIHSVNFIKATAKDVSQDFTPPLTAGTYWVRLLIEGMDLSGMDNEATYKISC